MKRLLFVLLASLSTVLLFGQHETLFSKSRVIGGFGGPLMEFGDVKGELSTSVGGGGGVIIDNFFIGAYGLGSVRNLRYNINNEDFKMDLAHGGLWMGYAPQTFKLIHPYTSLRLGWGFAEIRNDPFQAGDPFYSSHSSGDAVFVLTPEVGVELNLTRFFRIAGSVGYRWVNDVDQLEDFGNKDFRSVTGQLTLRFGWFGRKSAGQRIDNIDG
ncbi:MAG: hypothetical protein HKN87_21275 [Saprospiraceae bacterium]|nr:hypothetical protein [Saprospiraceae bacterium]